MVTATATEQVEFDVTISSDFSQEYEIGEKNNQVLGIDVLAGATRINSKSVQVELLGTLRCDVGAGQ
jgi:hypothetical protein